MNTVAVLEPIVNTPFQTTQTLTKAWQFGMEDARDGFACAPEMYFAKSDDKRDYCVGYASIAGATPTTRLFVKATITISRGPKAIDYEAELQELVEGREDEIFWGHHCR